MDRDKTKEKTREAYDRIGADYENWYWAKKARDLRAELTEKVVGMVKKNVKKGSKVLDLCCGTGHLVEGLEDYDYTGLDFAPAMVGYCKGAYSDKEFLIGDAEKMPFEDGSFDAVVCFWSFHHMLYPEKAMGEIRRVLNPGGYFAIATFKDVKLNLAARLADWISDHYWGYTTNRYSKSEMRKLTSRFKSVKLEIFPKGFSLLNAMGIRFIIASGRR